MASFAWTKAYKVSSHKAAELADLVVRLHDADMELWGRRDLNGWCESLTYQVRIVTGYSATVLISREGGDCDMSACAHGDLRGILEGSYGGYNIYIHMFP